MNISDEFKALKPLKSKENTKELCAAPTTEVSLIIPARNASESLRNTVLEAHTFLAQRYPNAFEIILVPNPPPGDQKDQSVSKAEELASQFQNVLCHPHYAPPGKGAAIRTGLQFARGKWVLFTDSDLPYDLRFFDQAIETLKSGTDLVTGNRRLSSSHFYIPVRLLRLAYGRHRLGLWYNKLVRTLLPIQTTDTQAGIKAMSRRLAQEVSQRQGCPGFLFDLEIFLTARGQGFHVAEFPVTLYLNSEKSTVRILRECILVGFWLTRIKARDTMKVYGSGSDTTKGKKHGILSRYRQASLGTKLFLNARWRLTPYTRMASRLPKNGTVLDLGCGHGLFALAAALHSPTRQVLGIDHDTARVQLGSQAVQDLPNIRIERGNMAQPPEAKQPYSAITMIDVMHYFDPSTQEHLLKRSYQLLDKGGKLLVREVDPEGGIAAKWNRLYERIATGIGFTKAEKQALHFRTQKGWKDLMEAAGFQVSAERCSNILFADILYTCERTH